VSIGPLQFKHVNISHHTMWWKETCAMINAASPERGQFVHRQLILSTHDIFHVHDHNKIIEKWCQISQSFMPILYGKTIQVLNWRHHRYSMSVPMLHTWHMNINQTSLQIATEMGEPIIVLFPPLDRHM
jgi:hypothetical protein